MATLEQSLKLNEDFSEKLSKVSSAVDNTLNSFEKFGKITAQDYGSGGTDKLVSGLNRSDETIKK